MPSEIRWFGVKSLISGQEDGAALKLREGFAVWIVFGEMRMCNFDCVFVGERPKPLIEHPVGILRQRQPVPRVVVPAVRELVNMSGINHRTASDSSGLWRILVSSVVKL